MIDKFIVGDETVFDICISLRWSGSCTNFGFVVRWRAPFLGSPALFRQKRPGLNDQLLEMVGVEQQGCLLSDGTPLPDESVTGFGKFLRSRS